MAGYTNNANFSQREFQIPIQDTDMNSPTYSFAGSPTSSNELPQNQLMQNQPGRAESMDSQGSRGAFNLGSILPTRGKKPSEPKTPGDKVEKVQKRRGPKPDSKPAQNRRQELNRAAQRTHRERKEQYLKDLEHKVSSAKATVEALSLQKNQLADDKKALEARVDAYESQIRHMSQLLEANNIPFIRANMANSQHPPATDDPVTYSNAPPTNNYAPLSSSYAPPSNSFAPPANSFAPPANSYLPQNSGPANYGGIGPSYKNSTMGYGTPNITPTTYAPSIQGPIGATQTPAYSTNDPSMLGFTTNPINNYAASSQGLSHFDNSQSLTTASYNRHLPHQAFKDPNDPKFVNFIMDLEETCMDHGNYVTEQQAKAHPEAYHGHALMLSEPTLTHMPGHPGNYQTQIDQTAVADLNLLLLNSGPFNRNGEVTPIRAAHIIMTDARFPLLTEEDFLELQKLLKARSRCYGFGAVLEDYEITDAMDFVCAKYL